MKDENDIRKVKIILFIYQFFLPSLNLIYIFRIERFASNPEFKLQEGEIVHILLLFYQNSISSRGLGPDCFFSIPKNIL